MESQFTIEVDFRWLPSCSEGLEMTNQKYPKAATNRQGAKCELPARNDHDTHAGCQCQRCLAHSDGRRATGERIPHPSKYWQGGVLWVN